MASLGRLKSAIFDREERKMQYQSHIRGLNAYDRHKKFMKDYGTIVFCNPFWQKHVNVVFPPPFFVDSFGNCVGYKVSSVVEMNGSRIEYHGNKIMSYINQIIPGKLMSFSMTKETGNICDLHFFCYIQFYGHEKNVDSSLPIKTDKDTLREGYRFILSEEDDMDSTWEKRLVKRYYDKLFKEYCIADMTHYKKGKIGLRWRTEKEVISGKGQFICGNRHCDEKHGLGSYEVNFSYVEAGEQKQALVKLVACKRCAEKLAYKRQKEKEKENELSGEKEIDLKDSDKRKRKHEENDDTSEDEDEKYRRKKKDRRGASSKSSGNNDEGFEEYLEGMFP